MQFGIALATTTESWRVVQRAEALGFDFAWFYDTQLLNPDVFIGMTQAAMQTQRIALATGVLIPSNRIEPVTANALATLNKIAPGRIHFGVGTGYTGRRTMGLRAISLSRMRSYSERVLALTRGEVVPFNMEGQTRDVGFLNPEFGLINVEDPIALHVSALGPKARRTVAQMGAGWINFAGDSQAAIKSLKQMQKLWAEEGREAGALYSTLFALGCVLRPGEGFDSERALAQAGPYVSVFFHNLVETTEPGAMEPVIGKALSDRLEAYRTLYLSYPEGRRHLHNHAGHLMRVRADERFLVTPELIASLTFTGDESNLRQRVEQLAQAGYSQLCVQLVEDQFDALDDWARVFGLTT